MSSLSVNNIDDSDGFANKEIFSPIDDYKPSIYSETTHLFSTQRCFGTTSSESSTSNSTVTSVYTVFSGISGHISPDWTQDEILDNIPEPVLIKVFDGLDFKSKLIAEQVCKEWKRLIGLTFNSTNSLLVKDYAIRPIARNTDCKPFGIKTFTDLKAVYLEEFHVQNVNAIILQKLASKVISRFNGLKTLYLYFSRLPFNTQLLSMLSLNCSKNLQHLCLICNGNNKMVFKKEDIIQLCHSLPNIKVFQIEALFLLIEEETVSAMITGWKHLEVFILEGILSNSEFDLQSKHYNGFCFENINPYIRVIRVPGSLLNNKSIQVLADKQLKHLEDLENYDFLNLTSIRMICDYFKSIKILSITSIETLSKERDAIELFSCISTLQHLTQLTFKIGTGRYNCSGDTIVTYDVIKGLKDCKNLKKLKIISTKVTNNCIESIARFIPNLVELKLIFVSFKSDPNVCISPIQSMQHLLRLKLCPMQELSDDSIIGIIHSCNRLTHLNVRLCERITIQVLDAMIESANMRPKDFLTIVLSEHLKEQVIQMSENIANNLFLKFKKSQEFN